MSRVGQGFEGEGLRVLHWAGLSQEGRGPWGWHILAPPGHPVDLRLGFGMRVPPHPVPICRFAPSLRQLKQQAFLLHFPPTLPSRLVQRLQEVRGLRRWGAGLGLHGWRQGRVGVTPVMVSSSPPHLSSTPLPSAVATPFPPSQVLG